MANVTRSRYDGRVVSGSFRRLKFPFKINEMVLTRKIWSDGVEIKFYKQNNPDRTFIGERRPSSVSLELSYHGLTLKSCYLYDADIDFTQRFYRLKVIGIDMEI